MPEKIDLVRVYKDYYKGTKKPQVLSFGQVPYLTIKGQGEPAGIEFSDKISLIYPMAYGVKKICKLEGNDFAVPKLEALWWVEGSKEPRKTPKSQWRWKLMIRMPDFVTAKIVETARQEVFKKKKIDLKDLKFETLNEGKCVQVMHLGPYSKEHETIDLMEEFIQKNSLKPNGFHHEIYLSDPNKTSPEKMKTILRQPVKP